MQRDNRSGSKTKIAFVCSGNTCRSPMAEGIFNKLAAERGINAEAESFGVSTVTGLPVSANSVKACAEIGVDISKKQSLPVGCAQLEKYGKFYCMSRAHASVLAGVFGISEDRIAVLNVSDPYGGNYEIYRRCRDEIFEAVKEIVKNYED